MRRGLCFLAAALTLMGLGGCASVLMPGNEYSHIVVTASCGSLPNVGARCTMVGGGNSTSFDTPAEIRVPNSLSVLSVECRGDLIGELSSVVAPKPNWGFVGNLLIGGAPGAVVDTATGRGFNYDRYVNLHRSQCFR